MSAVKSNRHAKTEGIAPKVAWPTAGLVGLGAVLLVLDAIGVIDIEDEVWITLLGSGIGAAGIGYSAPPALQKAKGGTTHATAHVPPVDK